MIMIESTFNTVQVLVGGTCFGPLPTALQPHRRSRVPGRVPWSWDSLACEVKERCKLWQGALIPSLKHSERPVSNWQGPAVSWRATKTVTHTPLRKRDRTGCTGKQYLGVQWSGACRATAQRATVFPLRHTPGFCWRLTRTDESGSPRFDADRHGSAVGNQFVSYCLFGLSEKSLAAADASALHLWLFQRNEAEWGIPDPISHRQEHYFTPALARCLSVLDLLVPVVPVHVSPVHRLIPVQTVPDCGVHWISWNAGVAHMGHHRPTYAAHAGMELTLLFFFFFCPPALSLSLSLSLSIVHSHLSHNTTNKWFVLIEVPSVIQEWTPGFREKRTYSNRKVLPKIKIKNRKGKKRNAVIIEDFVYAI